MAGLSSTMVKAVPFKRLRDGTHPLAAGPDNPGLLPRPGRSARHRWQVPGKPGPGRQIDSKDSPNGRQPISRPGRDPGPLTLLPPASARGTEPEVPQSTSSLPTMGARRARPADRAACAERPALDVDQYSRKPRIPGVCVPLMRYPALVRLASRDHVLLPGRLTLRLLMVIGDGLVPQLPATPRRR